MTAAATVIVVLAQGVTTFGGGTSAGLLDLSTLPVASTGAANKLTINLAVVAARAGKIVVRGKVGSVDTTEIVPIAVGDLTKTTTSAWTELSQIELMEVDESDTATTAANPVITLDTWSANLGFATYDTLQSLVFALSAVGGLTASTALGDPGILSSEICDEGLTSVDQGSSASIFGLNWEIETLVSASTRVNVTSSRRIKPSNVVFRSLSGGSNYGFDASGNLNSSTAVADYIAAFTDLQGVKNVVIVPLTTEASVHSALSDHCKYMEGVGRDERNGYAALDLSLNKAGIKSAIASLNNRNVSAVAQGLKAYDELGVLRSYDSKMSAVVAGSMQTGSAIGMPLTNKILNVTEVSQNSDWGPTRSAEEMIQNGLMFARFDPDRGVVWERSITTSRDSNAAFTEMSTNESVNVSTKRARKIVESRIGDRLFAGLAGVVKALIISTLQGQIEDGIIKSFNAESVTVTDIGDGFNVSYEIAPLEPVNFIRITAHIKRAPVSA